MVKHRKGGKKAPPKVHAGETVERLAPARGGDERDAPEPTDATEEPEEPEHDEASGEPGEAVSERDESGEPGDSTGVEAREGDSASDERAAQADDAVTDEPVRDDMSPETADEAALPVIDEPAASDELDETDEAIDPLAAALAAEASPRPVAPGVVLSDELPIDPDDDLRYVEGEASARLVSIIESLLFSAAKPMSVKDLRKVLQETSQHQIQLALRHLMEATRSRGVVLAQVAGGFQFRTHPDNAVWVQKMLQAKPAKLSRTQIETLAIVAYRQPITRPEIDDIRGVDSGAVLKSLLERELIQIVGKKEEPGRPLLYGTTVRFLEFFNLRTLRDLPTLRDFRDLSEESKATLRQRLGDLQMAEALGQEVLGFIGAEEAGEAGASEVAGSSADDADSTAPEIEASEGEAAPEIESSEGEAASEGRVEQEPTERADIGASGEGEQDQAAAEPAPSEPSESTAPAETEPSAGPGQLVDPGDVPTAPTPDELLAEHDALISAGDAESDLSEGADATDARESPANDSPGDTSADAPSETTDAGTGDEAPEEAEQASAASDAAGDELDDAAADAPRDMAVDGEEPYDAPVEDTPVDEPQGDEDMSPKTDEHGEGAPLDGGEEQTHAPADTDSDREGPAE